MGGERDNSWYALRVKARWEKHVATLLRQKGYEEFNPMYKCRRKWSDRYREVELPLFPGYIFCRAGPDSHGLILTTPGVLSFVGAGMKQSTVDEREIEAVRTIVRSGLFAEPWPYLEAGCRVQVVDGPLRTVQGIFLESKQNGKLVISITLLQRSIAVESDRDWVVPVGPLSVETVSRAFGHPVVNNKTA